MRPLRGTAETSEGALLQDARWGSNASCMGGALAHDPTVPEGLQIALAAVKQTCLWSYDAIKHDFTTWEMLGHRGSEIGGVTNATRMAFS